MGFLKPAGAANKFPHEILPLSLKRALKGLPSGALVPVAGVPEVSLLAVQVGMNERASAITLVLDRFMRPVPIA
jgi:hypothetical protein